jgi:hypothetical protein
MPQIKKDIRQKDKINLRCCICSIGIGVSSHKKATHNHIYQTFVRVKYKDKIYLMDKDCFQLVKKNPKLIKDSYF